MLTNLLNSIQTQLFSKSYLLGSLFPLLLFLAVNGLLLQRHSAGFRAWVGQATAKRPWTLTPLWTHRTRPQRLGSLA